VGRITDQLLDRFGERLAAGEADLHSLVSEQLPVGTIGHWMKLPPTDFALLRDLTRDMVYPQELLPSVSQLAKSDDAVAMLRTYFVNLVAERRARPSADPVSGWIASWDRIEPDREAADENVYYLSLFVVLAALETTATMLSQVVLNVLSHPAQWDWLTHHPEDVPGAVEESLRFDPPTHVISRIAAEDTALADTAIRADETVHLMVAAAGRDPKRHQDPDSFNIHRPRPVHLAFSGGVHYCLGAPLARLEARTLLGALLRRFPRLTLARTPQWHPRIAFRRPRTVDLTLA
jgi:cytochrome P450